jgi:hypothetical protein
MMAAVAEIQLNANGSGEVDDPDALVKAVSEAIRKSAPKISATVSVSRVEQLQPSGDAK